MRQGHGGEPDQSPHGFRRYPMDFYSSRSTISQICHETQTRRPWREQPRYIMLVTSRYNGWSIDSNSTLVFSLANVGTSSRFSDMHDCISECVPRAIHNDRLMILRLLRLRFGDGVVLRLRFGDGVVLMSDGKTTWSPRFRQPSSG